MSKVYRAACEMQISRLYGNFQTTLTKPHPLTVYKPLAKRLGIPDSFLSTVKTNYASKQNLIYITSNQL